MAGMPAMDDEKGKPPKKGIDLAIVFGKPKGKGSKPDTEPDGDEAEPPMSMSDHDGDELPPGFEDAAAEAFPEMAGDTERMGALKRLIHLCTDSY